MWELIICKTTKWTSVFRENKYLSRELNKMEELAWNVLNSLSLVFMKPPVFLSFLREHKTNSIWKTICLVDLNLDFNHTKVDQQFQIWCWHLVWIISLMLIVHCETNGWQYLMPPGMYIPVTCTCPQSKLIN